ncbi:MAG TPA: AraC family transcriptional regulator [Devosiaceae bacterium]|jgi:AraC-like DNA-binding protein
MSVDPLSDVLKTVRLTGAVFFDVTAKAPWVAEQPSRETVLPLVLAGAEHLISYHVVTEGRCYASTIGGEPVTVEAGEVIVFTNGDPHVLSSMPGMRASAFDPHVVENIAAGPLPFVANYGAGGPVAAKLVCGFLACDARPFNPLLDNLPPVIKAADPGGNDAGWLAQFIRLAASESACRQPGSDSVLAKLSELMFIEVVRRHIQTLPAERAGWLAGLNDPHVGKALSEMHAAPERDWTIEELARLVGLSRSPLAARFAELVGIPPMQYLAKWRMQSAAALLSGGHESIAVIADQVGYASVEGFSRAFSKMVGMSPSAWRQRFSRLPG